MIRTEAQGAHRDRRRHDHVERRQVAVGDHQPGRGCRPKVGVGTAEGDADSLRVEAEAARTGERERGRLGCVDKVQPGRVEGQSAGRDVRIDRHVQGAHLPTAEHEPDNACVAPRGHRSHLDIERSKR